MITIITPTHNPRWLAEAWASLQAQNYAGDWEWLIVPNGGCVLPPDIASAKRVRIEPYPAEANRGVGALKRFCCEQAKGEIIVELDHDDMLTPHALQTIVGAFADPSVDFIYSNSAEFFDRTWKPHVYDGQYGWETRECEFYGHKFQEIRAFAPTAQSLCLIYYAPNHVRAWRATAYWDIGGHDPKLATADDHDLCCRLYLNKQMKFIDDCLYLYRMHEDNTFLVQNKDVQWATRAVQDKYIWPLVQRWAELESLPMVDLGAAHDKPEGYVGVDLIAGPDVNVVHDVTQGLPFDDDSVGVVRAADFLEHIPDSVTLMNEIYRVLVDGGWLLSLTPSTDGRGAFQDPTHLAWWNENSFWYYTNRFYAGYVAGIECRFQVMRLKTDYPSDFHKQHEIPYVYADLVATKSWRRRPGMMKI